MVSSVARLDKYPDTRVKCSDRLTNIQTPSEAPSPPRSYCIQLFRMVDAPQVANHQTKARAAPGVEVGRSRTALLGQAPGTGARSRFTS